MALVELAPEQLCVRAIHRLLNDLGSLRIRDALVPVFDVRDAGANDAAGVVALEAAMRRERALGLVDAEGLALLVPTAALERLVAELPEPLRGVDAARIRGGRAPCGDRRLARLPRRCDCRRRGREGQRGRRPCSCAPSTSRRSGWRPAWAYGCPRRPRSSRRSPEREWCSAASTCDGGPQLTSHVAPELINAARSPWP